MLCEYCGSELKPGSRYCENCGRKVHEYQSIGKSTQTQLYIPITNQRTLFDPKNSLYIIDKTNNKIISEYNEELGKIIFKEKFFKIKCKIYDYNGDLVLLISPVLLSKDIFYKISDAKGMEIARITNSSPSSVITHFYIESPFREKWFQIVKTSNYKIKSIVKDDIVAEFGRITTFNEIFLDFDIVNPNNVYLLKINDEKVDRAVIIGSYLAHYMFSLRYK
ncbi:MAG: zinc ribbon domain-containing protein [Promethearchaeota archaeon]|nr:MAG: zinc ribbon domain-containing protein [Candidatus Lokiarchaeota archaeon]